MARRKQAEEPKVLEIDGIPTAAGLAARGRHLAFVRGDGRYQITDEGHALLGSLMRERAQAAIDRGETAWVRPPSSGRERNH